MRIAGNKIPGNAVPIATRLMEMRRARACDGRRQPRLGEMQRRCTVWHHQCVGAPPKKGAQETAVKAAGPKRQRAVSIWRQAPSPSYRGMKLIKVELVLWS